MENALFECSYQHTDAISGETLRFLYFREPMGVLLSIVHFVPLVITVGLIVFEHVVLGRILAMSWVLLALCVLLPLTRILHYSRARANTRKRVKEMYGDQTIEVRMSASEDGITYFDTTRAEPRTIPFSEIKRVYETENTVLLYSKTRVGYSFVRSGFTKGDAASLVRFLHEKGIR